MTEEKAVQKLHPCPTSSCSPVEAALPGPVFDLSSLVLYGAQAVPVRLKILLDRVFSILTPKQVGHILPALGWSVEDYMRGYVLQDASGTPLDRWLMVSPEEEMLVLQQFLRFGETRSIAESMFLQSAAAVGQLSHPHVTPPRRLSHLSLLQNKERPGGTRRTDPHLVDDVCHRQLLPFLSPSSAYHRVHPPPEVTPSECLLRRGGGAVKEANNTSDDHGAMAEEKVSPSAPSFTSSLIPPPPSLSCGLQQNFVSASNHPHRAAGQKGRVSCGICAKSFYDKGTLKIHYNAVHLKIKHGCTVVGCSMFFSSLRSRNRHSANPNPRLHGGASGAYTRSDLHPGEHMCVFNRQDTPPPPRPQKIKDGSQNAAGPAHLPYPPSHLSQEGMGLRIHTHSASRSPLLANTPTNMTMRWSAPPDAASKGQKQTGDQPTNQQRGRSSGDWVSRKRPRKSTPVKIVGREGGRGLQMKKL